MGEKMQQSTKGKSNIKTLVLVTVLAAVAIVAGILGKDFWEKYSAERARINKQIELLNQKQEVISDLEEKLERAEKDMRILIDGKPSESQDLNVSQVKDAYFLARLAEDRLQYAGDVQAAKQLLHSAQEHLASLNTPEINQVKIILDADLAKLNAANQPDLEETKKNLATLDELINSLPLKADKAIVDKGVVKTNNQKMQFDKEWKRSLNAMLEDLKTVVKVRKKSDPDVDMSYINVEISRAQFKLLIEQIRWSLFYRDSVVYQRSVKNAQELLGQLFDPSNESVQKFSSILNELSKVQLQADVPSIRDLVNALQAILVR